MTAAPMPSLPIEDTFTTAVLAVFRANGTMMEWGDAFSAPLGLTSARWQMLGALALSGEPQSSPRVADFMGMTRQGAQKQLNLLLTDGLVERLVNPANARSPLYRLSRRGQARYREADTQWKKQVGALSRHFDAKELARTAALLGRLAEVFSQDVRKGTP